MAEGDPIKSRLLMSVGLHVAVLLASVVTFVAKPYSTPPAEAHSTPVPAHAMHSRNPRLSIRSMSSSVPPAIYLTTTVAFMWGWSAQKYW